VERIRLEPRANWRARNEEIGFSFHSMGATPSAGPSVYWDERAAYQFKEREILELEKATQELNRLCLSAVDHVIFRDRFAELGIPAAFATLCRESWDRDDPTLYGRFDFRFDGTGAPKMLEYNADTPTALLEASVAQWVWLEDVMPEADQFNSLHEKLLEQFGWMRSQRGVTKLHFSSVTSSEEDRVTVEYLRDVATQAKMQTAFVPVEEIGWHETNKQFVDLENAPIKHLFKLYPWEWIVHEPFGQHLLQRSSLFLEPAWKMILSNKGILPILWELSPGHPNLLPSYRSLEALRGIGFDGGYVKKPLLSREGANISIEARDGTQVRTGGEYGDEGFIYQVFAPLPNFGSSERPLYPVIGSWIVGDMAAGIGIREAESLITDNTSRFVPHFFV
jgi:glutathionylspermidine synthase